MNSKKKTVVVFFFVVHSAPASVGLQHNMFLSRLVNTVTPSTRNDSCTRVVTLWLLCCATAGNNTVLFTGLSFSTQKQLCHQKNKKFAKLFHNTRYTTLCLFTTPLKS